MLGQHDGIAPLSDPDKAASVMLKAMGRLKAGKDVPARRAAIRSTLQQINPEDRFWMESMVSHLSGEAGLEAIPAHVVTLAAAWALAEDDVARIIRGVNTQQSDPYLGRAVMGLSAAAPEFGKRLRDGRINSDEVFLRVALAHLFRRDPDSTFQMFVIDGVVRTFGKAMHHDAQSFVKLCLERFEEEDVPEIAWGYVMVLWDLNARSGYFIPEPKPEADKALIETRREMEKILGPLDNDTFAHHAAASYVQGYLRGGTPGKFAAAIAPILKLLDMRCVVIYTREERQGPGGGGLHTRILRIPTDDPAQARKMVSNMPEIRMHDDFRRLSEFLAQQEEFSDITPDA